METHELDIAIQPDGKVQVHIKGVKGPGCEEYVKLFEQLLAARGEIEHTTEYYEPPTDVKTHLEQNSRN